MQLGLLCLVAESPQSSLHIDIVLCVCCGFVILARLNSQWIVGKVCWKLRFVVDRFDLCPLIWVWVGVGNGGA